MSQLRLAPFVSCCSVRSRELCASKMGFRHLTWQSEEAQANMEIYTNALTESLFPGYSFEYVLRRRPPGEPQRTARLCRTRGFHLTAPVTFLCLACSHRSPMSCMKGLSTEKHSVGMMPYLCVCVCVFVASACLSWDPLLRLIIVSL